MLQVTPLFAKVCLMLVAASAIAGCWKFRPSRWADRYVDSNYMHFEIGVHQFRSFIGTVDGGRGVIDLDRLPSAYTMETQSGIFAILRDREENFIQLYLYLPSLQPGRYVLADTAFGLRTSLAYFDITCDGRRRTYRSSERAPTIVEITELDSVQNVLRGRLHMQAELVGRRSKGNWPSILNITDGVFEIRSLDGVWKENPFK